MTSSLRRTSWVVPMVVAVALLGVIVGVALHLTALAVAAVVGAVLCGLVARVPVTHRERTLPVAAQQGRATYAPETLVQRAVALPSGEIHQGLVIPVEQAEGYQLVLTVDGYQLLNARNEVVTRPQHVYEG